MLSAYSCARPDAVADTFWQGGATCYEIFVRSFADSDGDGIGDLRGLSGKLDYINDGNPATANDLGATCVWLMPVMESPSYHGYDANDLYRVERDYGTADDFKAFVAAAHQRGVRVLIDIMLNHVSSEHPAFKEALRDTSSQYRQWFRWSDTLGPLNKWGGQNWHRSPARNEYYYAFFWQGMPDLNYEHPAALAEMQRVATFWLTEMGVDGFRLDAVKFLAEKYNKADDTPGTHRVLNAFGKHVNAVKPGAFTVGEVFDSTGSLLSYYPDQLQSYFAFEVADSVLQAVRRGSGNTLLPPVLRLQREVPDQRWSTFLRNHDQPRTTTELGGDMTAVRLAATLQFTLPGIPFVYYGEELGMSGAKPDERIRTPMAWANLAPHAGFSTGTPWQSLQSDSATANVEVQSADSGSILTLYRKLIRLRSQHAALARGTVVPLVTNDSAVVAFIRLTRTEAVLVMANLGMREASKVRLSADSTPLAVGTYAATPLLSQDAGVFTSMPVSAGGAIREYRPIRALPPRSAYVMSLSPESPAGR